MIHFHTIKFNFPSACLASQYALTPNLFIHCSELQSTLIFESENSIEKNSEADVLLLPATARQVVSFLVFALLIFMPMFSSSFPLLSFCITSFFQKVSLSLSAAVIFKSEILPREIVGLKMWRSASAGDVVCPGLMSF